MQPQSEVKVVLESDEYGREIFSFPDEDEAFAAVHRLLERARSAFQHDRIERVIGILVTGRKDWLDEEP